MTVQDNCTLCGGPRDSNISQAEFYAHIASERHQQADREWEEWMRVRREQRPARARTHHDGHVALKITCRCDG